MKCLTTGILALSVTVTATAAPAADYEIFAPAYISALEGQHWAVERLDYKNKHLYHCGAFFDTETKKLTGQCTERPAFRKNRQPKGRICRQRCQRISVDCAWAIGRSTGLPAKPSSVPWALLSAWR